MYVEGSQPIVHFRRVLKQGVFGKKKGISSACSRWRPPSAAYDGEDRHNMNDLGSFKCTASGPVCGPDNERTDGATPTT